MGEIVGIGRKIADLHSTLVRFYGQQLRSNFHSIYIYIPHWLDSMPYLENSNEHTWFHLHSTLVRFYVRQSKDNGVDVLIYIPHWLDSMPAAVFPFHEVFDLHSTLVRFYVKEHCKVIEA